MSGLIPPSKIEDRDISYDDNTMMKVAESIRDSLRDILGTLADERYIVQKTTEIVGSMQSKGILFRERV